MVRLQPARGGGAAGRRGPFLGLSRRQILVADRRSDRVHRAQSVRLPAAASALRLGDAGRARPACLAVGPPSLYRIASATAYLVALSVALEGMLAEAIVMALVALGCKLLYLDWMVRFYNRTVVSQ